MASTRPQFLYPSTASFPHRQHFRDGCRVLRRAAANFKAQGCESYQNQELTPSPLKDTTNLKITTL
jgi:hypothetical protein